MTTINIFGDFKCNDVSRLKLGDSLSEILANGNINIVNFEAPIPTNNSIPIEKSGHNITNDQKAPDFLQNAGFNLFSLANNHIYDYGADGLCHTREMFPKGKTIGAGNWQEAYRLVIIEISDIKLGFIALTHHEFGVLYEQSYQQHEVGAAWMLHPSVDEIIVEAKNKCDYLFILCHCGMEHEYYPMPEVRTIYRHWINMGVDGVFASHPHTPQPWEYYNNKPIVYSLGNFCFDSLAASVPNYWYWSLLVSIEFNEKDPQIRVYYCKYDEHSGIICIVEDDALFNKHMEEILSVFSNENKYFTAIDSQCAKYEKIYDNFFCKIWLL